MLQVPVRPDYDPLSDRSRGLHPLLPLVHTPTPRFPFAVISDPTLQRRRQTRRHLLGRPNGAQGRNQEPKQQALLVLST
jgi:hypothetical protein